MVRTLMASTASLSTLTRPPSKKKAVADEEDRGAPNASNASPPARAADDDKDDDDDDDDKGKAKKTKKAESDDDDDDDDDDKSHARVRRVTHATVGASAEDDDDGDRADDSNTVTRAARDRERGKIRAILESPTGKAAFEANPNKVMRFLTTYSGSRNDAIATLELLGPTDKPTTRVEPLRERMNANPVPSAGADDTGSGNGQQDVVALILSADKMRRGEK